MRCPAPAFWEAHAICRFGPWHHDTVVAVDGLSLLSGLSIGALRSPLLMRFYEGFVRRVGEVCMSMALNGSTGDTSGDMSPDEPGDGGAYRPGEGEPFMNPRQLAYFKAKLIAWKESLHRESAETLTTLQNESLREPDVTDRASSETDWSLELRTRDRQRKLIAKIDAALRRIEDGEYGYCEVTGEPISLGRLEARPIATMTVEAQERHERQEKISRDE
jgi:DnaK suppressor protein